MLQALLFFLLLVILKPGAGGLEERPKEAGVSNAYANKFKATRRDARLAAEDLHSTTNSILDWDDYGETVCKT